MDRILLKKTLSRTLRWYPLVIIVMVVLGVALASARNDPMFGIVLALIGATVGPTLEATAYYLGERKKGQRAAAQSTADPAARLRQANQLLKDGLISEEEYEQVREAVLAGLSGEPAQAATPPGAVEMVSPRPQTARSAMKIHPILAALVAVGWPVVGFGLCMVIEMVFNITLSKLVRSLINLPIGFLGVYYILPVVNHAPFGPVPQKEYTQRIGFYLPPRWWRHLLLGVVLAACTLSGMLVASLLTGRYVLDWSQINLSHIVFSLNPGIFEEIFYRGILVMLLLPLLKSVKRALILQIVIFGILHISSLELLQVIDSFSVIVIAIAFTYVAYKTRTLLAGIVFHFLHDALLFFVQVPDGVYIGVRENAIFYSILWGMVGVACLVTWFAAEKLDVRAGRELYASDAV